MVTADAAASACPSCGVLSSAVKGQVRTRPRDLPYGAAPLRLVWHKRRWRCRETACERGSFTESIPAVPARARLTTRLRARCGAGVAEGFSCVAAAAWHYRVSWPVAHAAFVAHVSPALAAPLPVVRVLGIDETRRGKPTWTKDPATGRWRVANDRWHTGLVDAVGTGGLLAHVDGRTATALTDWLNAQPQPWRDAITHVTIDLSASYRKAVTLALPDAVIVADPFHLVRLANDMLTEVRQRVTRQTRGRRGRRRDPEWAARRRLLTAHERLTPKAFARLWNSLIDAGDPGVQVLHAYTVKENLRQLLALAGTHPERAQIRERLWRFYTQAASSDAPEVHRLATTIEDWWPAIEAAITTGYSNARSEGYNRLANTKDATPSASATSPTNAAAYAGPAPANTGERQPRPPRCPVKFDEPCRLASPTPPIVSARPRRRGSQDYSGPSQGASWSALQIPGPSDLQGPSACCLLQRDSGSQTLGVVS